MENGKKKVMKTQDRKKLIRLLTLKVRYWEKLARKYYDEFDIVNKKSIKLQLAVRRLDKYINSTGTKEQKAEFKRIVKDLGVDKWL